MKQPNGLPVQYICISVGRSARTKYALSLCARNGYIDKVRTIIMCVTVMRLTYCYHNPYRVTGFFPIKHYLINFISIDKNGIQRIYEKDVRL